MEMDKTINNREDTRELINYVRYETEIYTNTRLNIRSRSNCWNAIAAKFDGKYSAAECRRKWKSLKDSYKKFLKQRTNGRRSQWVYAKDLDFIYELCISEMSRVARRKCNGFRQLQSRGHFRTAMHVTIDTETRTFDDRLEELLRQSFMGSDSMVADRNSLEITCDLNDAAMIDFSYTNEYGNMKDFYDFSQFGIDSVCDTLQTVAEAVSIVHDTAIEMPSELDTFFDYLKDRVQNLPGKKIPEAQAKLMACVLNIEESYDPR